VFLPQSERPSFALKIIVLCLQLIHMTLPFAGNLIEVNMSLLPSSFYLLNSQDSSVVQRWATGWMIGGLNSGGGWEFFSSPRRPNRLWSPPSLLSNGYQWFFPWG
jgi:hypothetical protein